MSFFSWYARAPRAPAPLALTLALARLISLTRSPPTYPVMEFNICGSVGTAVAPCAPMTLTECDNGVKLPMPHSHAVVVQYINDPAHDGMTNSHQTTSASAHRHCPLPPLLRVARPQTSTSAPMSTRATRRRTRTATSLAPTRTTLRLVPARAFVSSGGAQRRLCPCPCASAHLCSFSFLPGSTMTRPARARTPSRTRPSSTT